MLFVLFIIVLSAGLLFRTGEPKRSKKLTDSNHVILRDRSLGGVWLVCRALLRVFMLGLVCGFGVLLSDCGTVQFLRATAQSR